MRFYIQIYKYFLITFILYLDHEDFNDAVESYASVKRLKGKLKKVPVRLRTSVNNDNTNQKGLRKIIKRNIIVTDFDQVFDVLITCIFIFLVNLFCSQFTFMVFSKILINHSLVYSF